MGAVCPKSMLGTYIMDGMNGMNGIYLSGNDYDMHLMLTNSPQQNNPHPCPKYCSISIGITGYWKVPPGHSNKYHMQWFILSINKHFHPAWL